MELKQQFLAGIFFCFSFMSWMKIFYWRFDEKILWLFVPAILGFVVSIILVATSD